MSTASERAVHTDLAAALYMQAQQAGSTDPAVRGADWRMAIVQTVGTDGTVTTTDGVIARRVGGYVSPAVNDVIVIEMNSLGSWITPGRTAPVTTAGTWQALSFAGTWSAWGSPYYTPAYRINADGTVAMCGLARAPASTTTTSTVGTLPTAARPASKCRFAAQFNTSVMGVIDVNTDGTIQATDFTGTCTWATLDVVRFRLT